MFPLSPKLVVAALVPLVVLGAACGEPGSGGPPAAAQEALARARARFAAEEPFEAIREAERAVELAPEWPEAHLALGKLLFTYSDVRFSTATIDRGRLDQAIEHLERAAALDPASADAALWAGRALFKADRYPDAERRLTAALELAPEHGQALRELGFVQAAAGESARAVETLTRARAHLPKDGELLLQLGLQLEAEERLEEARDAYLAAAAANPAHPGPRSALVVLYGRLGDPEAAERARAEFERCRAIGKRLTAATQRFEANRRDPAAAMGLAALYQELGMPAEAIQWAERALRIDPEHAPARALLDELRAPSGSVSPAGLDLSR